MNPATDVVPESVAGIPVPSAVGTTVQALLKQMLAPWAKFFLFLAAVCWIAHFVFSILMLSHIFLLLTAIGLTAFGLYLLALAAGQELGMKMLTKSIGHDLS